MSSLQREFSRQPLFPPNSSHYVKFLTVLLLASGALLGWYSFAYLRSGDTSDLAVASIGVLIFVLGSAEFLPTWCGKVSVVLRVVSIPIAVAVVWLFAQ